ncbi:conserved hypothetical protein [Methanohalobium evestigatum Z-7303]|uniref:Uncharacterized protein n=1 Tax=Methanohalobium evestigatum (strain ATCC BAA-1072 / DSM 3721 / NBRC 107634 / OCM 161 / Z-7303) TaxID=644295 RepID=D7EBU0_METEZ|nr:hypothetical protein [Methanohalobium evestigatum]ADI75062.1 conserved hypothetical protein [Methanohalobium evestigatum Z-7303]
MEKGTVMDRKNTRFRGIAKQQIREDVLEKINEYQNNESSSNNDNQ